MENFPLLVILMNLLGSIFFMLGALIQFCVPEEALRRKARAIVSLSFFMLGALFVSGVSLLMVIAVGILLFILTGFIIWGFCLMLCSFFPSLKPRFKGNLRR